jgi:hypothetical protein
VFLWQLRDSALFYSDRVALVTDEGGVLRRLERRRPFACIMATELYDALGDRLAGAFVLDREGGKVVVANRSSYDELGERKGGKGTRSGRDAGR